VSADVRLGWFARLFAGSDFVRIALPVDQQVTVNVPGGRPVRAAGLIGLNFLDTIDRLPEVLMAPLELLGKP
jgi:hypothetical protein